jgi:hypothetical protein
MHRSRALSLLVGTLVGAAVLAAPVTAAAQVQRNFPQNALRGEIQFAAPPEIVVNRTPARLAPGARIRGTDNMLVMSGSILGQRAVVNYTLEPSTGLVKDVWLLRPEEISRRPWPTTPQEAATWSFDPAAQTWTRR